MGMGKKDYWRWALTEGVTFGLHSGADSTRLRSGLPGAAPEHSNILRELGSGLRDEEAAQALAADSR